MQVEDDLEANLEDEDIEHNSHPEIPLNPAPPYTPYSHQCVSARCFTPYEALTSITPSNLNPYSDNPHLHTDTDAPPRYYQQTT